MKKIFIVIFSIFILLTFFTGCNLNKNKVEFKDDFGYNTPSVVTYKFIGKSKHFAFHTGKAYYANDNYQYLYINNFEKINTIKDEKNIISYKIYVLFNNKSLTSDEMNELNGDKLDDKIKNFEVEESGIAGNAESDAFLETSKYNFKKYIKVKIKYCFKNNKCEEEPLNISYIE